MNAIGARTAMDEKDATRAQMSDPEGGAGQSAFRDGQNRESVEHAAGVAASDAGAGPPHGGMRYSRRRVIVLGGALVAGAAAVIAGLRAFGGSAVSNVGEAISDQFGPFPVRSVEAVPQVPADHWVVKVDGLVETPLTVDRSAWMDLQRASETADFHCVEGWTVDDVRWGGVAPSVLLDQAGVRPEARYAVFYAYDSPYLSTVPLDLVRDSATLLADSLNGEPLPPKHGGPLRLVVPRQLGYKSVKWVERIELTASIRAGYWEQRGYPEDAPVRGG
jgi:DMSO/TMAO reductase YedYZ molybdopterin-dependent catalytic subunit